MTLLVRSALGTVKSFNSSIVLTPARMTLDSTQKANVKKGDEHTKTALTPPMPKKRERRLTLPLDDTQEPTLSKSWFRSRPKAQVTLEQTTSILFTKLPAEIRALIYTFAICDEEKSRLNIGFRGSPVASMNTSNKPGYIAAYRDDDASQRTWGLDKGVLSLMRTCRLIYTEAIPLLYSTPTFVFSHTGPLTFMAFVATILPERKDAIRWLDLEGLDCQRTGGSDEKGAKEDVEFSYAFVRHLVMYTELPDARIEGRKLTEGWAVEQVLDGMEGLRRAKVIGWSEGECEKDEGKEALTRRNGI